jgi:hypothetical protein
VSCLWRLQEGGEEYEWGFRLGALGAARRSGSVGLKKGRNMRSRIITIVVVCGLLGVIAAFAAGGDDAAGSSELEALKEQVKTLEQRVAALEKRLGPGPLPRIVPMPSPGLRGRQVPEGWLPREFNGMPYYIIPIHNDPNAAVVPPK